MKTKLLILVVMAALVYSCSTSRVVTVPQIRTEFVHDTLRTVDSVYRSRVEVQRGDTIFLHDTLYQFRVLTKKIEVCKTDSVPYAVEVVKEVRVRNAYDKATARGFWILLSIGVLSIVILIFSKTKYGKVALAVLKNLF